ncbi:MAG: PilZ domain-containing protein [Candidatus Omnitrophica bacterium]|nr:PilZ domain-containing protein [Candidatus Omnitrophota bacterium]MBI2174519.1 PilZ domain-containing protein [Candidatus Omnitrophota bacterium]MBI3009434.1 PilZ domain-containing protein [Candidatus Omnitrophota bacterium]
MKVARKAAFLCVWVISFSCFAANGFSQAAETTDPAPQNTTRILLKIGSADPLAVQATYQDSPPTINISFPGQTVMGSVPERTVFARGPVRSILARYESSQESAERFLRGLQIVLSGAFPYRVRSEPSQVVVELDHPASFASAALEVQIRRGTIIQGREHRQVSERFRAMQAALDQALPTPWSFHLEQKQSSMVTTVPKAQAIALLQPPQTSFGSQATGKFLPQPSLSQASFVIMFFGLAALTIWLFFIGLVSSGSRRQKTQRVASRVPSGIVLMDQLVWRAFEQQGYRLILEQPFGEGLCATVRLMAKDNTTAALCVLSEGALVEKQTIDRCARVCRALNAPKAFLVAPAAFTVPAQRVAQERGLTLIGRDQLTELLGTGAKQEALAQQLARQNAQLSQTQEVLQQSVTEADLLRRQRNEASWYLGEERARSAQVALQLEELQEQLRRHQDACHRLEQDVLTWRQRWDESQWYLGEARVRIQYLENQWASLSEMAKQAECLAQEKEQISEQLAEEQSKRKAAENTVAALKEQLNQARQSLERLGYELNRWQTLGERRRKQRVLPQDSGVEILLGETEEPVRGSLKDVSLTGIGIETSQKLPEASGFSLRLSLPGMEPVLCRARRVWQDESQNQRNIWRSGFQFSRLSRDSRKCIRASIRQIASA